MEGTRFCRVQKLEVDTTSDSETPPSTVVREVKVWATPTFLGGRELLSVETVVSDRRAKWRVSQAGIRDINQGAWVLIDDQSLAWDIQAVTEPPGPRGVWWDLHAERQE